MSKQLPPIKPEIMAALHAAAEKMPGGKVADAAEVVDAFLTSIRSHGYPVECVLYGATATDARVGAGAMLVELERAKWRRYRAPKAR